MAHAPSLPTPNAGKTLAIVTWILQTQRLPIHILVPKKAQIVSALKNAVGRGKLDEILDALKVSSVAQSVSILTL